MKHILSNPWHEILRFDKGEDVVAGILDFVEKNWIKAAGFRTKIGVGAWLSAIGSASEVELGFYALDKRRYLNKTFKGPFELAEASGTLAVKGGKPILHWHGVLSEKNYKTIGGHIHRLIANATVEVFIHKLGKFGDVRLERKLDPQTGLNLLT